MKLRLSLFGLCWMMSLAATANNDGLAALLKVLRDNGTLTAAQYDQLQQAISSPSDASIIPIEASDTEEEISDETEADIAVRTKGGLELMSYDGEFSFELGGRLMLDSAFYNQNKNLLGNGTELRRARIDMEGTLFSDWDYALGFDFAKGDADVKDAYIAYNGIWPWQLQIGHFKEPFSLDELSSSKYATFMENALPNALVPGRHLGLGLHRFGINWTWAGAVSGEGFDADVDAEGDEGWGLSSRLTFAPYHSDTEALHFGAALAYRQPNDEATIKLNSRPESHITDLKFLDTGSINQLDHSLLYGLEIAGVWSAISVQGEYMQMQLKRLGDHKIYHFNGFYAYASWFLTGESRVYKFKKGAFGRVTPKQRIGAWELALRYSQLDLNDAAIVGGSANHWTLGLNWYLNEHLRLMANYIQVNNDEYADAAGDVSGNDDPAIFQMRLQIDF